MESRNPYCAPGSDVSPADSPRGRTTRYLLAALSAVQVSVWLLSLQSLLGLTREGDISAIALLGCLASAAALVVAGFLVIPKSRISRWFYAASALLAASVFTSVPVPAAKTALLIGLVCSATTWLLPRSHRAVA
ncbi:hypothetical protein PAGU2638_28610 [Lysobacter sp. PAGU 2638]